MKAIKINNFEEILYYEKLKSGLEVYLVPLKNKKKFFVSFTTKYGNQYTSFKIDNKLYNVPSGIAHFLEHKLFEREDGPQPFDFYAQSGSDVNAGTSIFYTQYYFSGNNMYLDNLKYLLNWIPKIYITPDTVEKEKGIIIQEARMHADNPDRLLGEKIRENAFLNDSFGKRVIGEETDILNITRDELLTCYKAFYRPDNMFIISVGDFDQEEAISLIKKELNNFKNPKEKVVKEIIDEPNQVKKEYEKIVMDVVNDRLAFNYKINKKRFKTDNYGTQLYLSMILSLAFGSTSDFRENGLKKNLFINLGTNFISSDTHYLFGITAITDKTDILIDELKDYFKNIKISIDDFERIKKSWIASEIRSIDNINATANDILTDIIEFKEYKNNKIEDLKKLTYFNLQKTLKALDFKNLSIVVISSNTK